MYSSIIPRYRNHQTSEKGENRYGSTNNIFKKKKKENSKLTCYFCKAT